MIYHLYIELLESEPLVWRRIIIPPSHTLYGLHMAIQGAFGWENSHLFRFSEKWDCPISYEFPYDDQEPDERLIDARLVTIDNIFKKELQEFSYIYDFGDNWHHLIRLEKIENKDAEFPFCTDGAGACPPEDVGGIYAYKEMLVTLMGKETTEKEELTTWLSLVPGEKWNAELCSLREANKRLAMLSFEK